MKVESSIFFFHSFIALGINLHGRISKNSPLYKLINLFLSNH